MRGIYNSVTDIRRKVFTEDRQTRLRRRRLRQEDRGNSPYKILPGHKASYRNSIFLERAIIGERLRPGHRPSASRAVEEQSALSDGIEESAIAEKVL